MFNVHKKCIELLWHKHACWIFCIYSTMLYASAFIPRKVVHNWLWEYFFWVEWFLMLLCWHEVEKSLKSITQVSKRWLNPSIHIHINIHVAPSPFQPFQHFWPCYGEQRANTNSSKQKKHHFSTHIEHMQNNKNNSKKLNSKLYQVKMKERKRKKDYKRRRE